MTRLLSAPVVLGVLIVFSQTLPVGSVPNQIFEVISTADTTDGSCTSGSCTLREAIEAANASPGLDEIRFNIPPDDPGHVFYQNNSLAGFLSGIVTVTTVADDANLPNPDPDYPHSWFRISPSSPLPAITDPVIIDGYTQGSSTPAVTGDDALPNSGSILQGLNTVIKIELFGANAGFVANGLLLGTGSNGSTIRGLAIQDFRGNDSSPGHGIFVASNECHIEGNFIGPGPDGITRSLNTHGIQVVGASNTIGGLTHASRNLISGNNRTGLLINGGTGGNLVQGNIIGLTRTGLKGQGNFRDGLLILSSPDNRVGGTHPNARNIVSNNGYGGIAVVLAAAARNIVQGNYIGTDVTGNAAIGNTFHGIYLYQAPDNILGGTETGSGNLCSGNGYGGITLEQSNANSIIGNTLGTNPDQTLSLGNGFSGILLVASSENLIGGSQAASNTIAYNKTGGVVISGNSTGNPVRMNSILSNQALGIDLTPVLGGFGVGDGVTSNDLNDTDTGPNNLQNYPVLSNVDLNGTLNVTYSINSVSPNSAFPLTVDFYLADTSGEEGKTYLGSDSYNSGDGQKPIALSPETVINPGNRVVATATDANGNTSEFSASVLVGGEVVPTVLTVNSTGDAPDLNLLDGACDTGNQVEGQPECTLCAALAQANVMPDISPSNPVQIRFAVPTSAAGHLYYKDDAVAGQVTAASASTTTAANDSLIADIDPDWPHSWYSIKPDSALPQVTQPVVIDGYSQTGSLVNTNSTGSGLNTRLRIEVTGVNAGRVDEGLIKISATGSTIKGLAINRADGPKIRIDTLGNNRIEGNFIGPDVSGTLAYPTPGGPIRIISRPGVLLLSQGNRVGGLTPSDRNLIAGNRHLTGTGITIEANSNQVQGNLIGTDRTGTESLSNSIYGISIVGSEGNLVGGNTTSSVNVIADGVIIGGQLSNADRNGILGNIIGAGIDGKQLPSEEINIASGVFISGDNNTVFGNTIAFRGGVTVSEGVGNIISRNSISSTLTLGINLTSDKELKVVNLPQDELDGDTGANGLQNFPYITGVSQTSGGTTVNGILHSTPNSNYRLEFFASRERDPTAFGEGEHYLGSLDITTNSLGENVYTANLPIIPAGFQYVSATATDITVRAPANTPANNTSEFSGAFPLAGCGLTVTNTTDSGPGPLREALHCANTQPGVDTIAFAIPGAGPHVIQPETQLPEVVDPVIIDGYTQGDSTPGNTTDDAVENTSPLGLGANTVLKVQLDGTKAPELTCGLILLSGGSTVRGLSITGFDDIGVLAQTYGGNTFSGNFIGVTPDGNPEPNYSGIYIDQCPDNVVGGLSPADRNVISDNYSSGVEIDGGKSGITATGSLITGNLLGAGPDLQPIGNQVGVYAGCTDAVIVENLIAFNRETGVIVPSETISRPPGSEITILRNSIYSNEGIGIDLDEDGVTVNDGGNPPDQDEGGNGLQNYPVLTSRTDSPTTVVNGTLSSTPNTAFRIEFFANTFKDPTGFGEGEVYLGSVNVTTDVNGNSPIVFNVQQAVPESQSICATATRRDDQGEPVETSEFSIGIGGNACSTVVTQTGDGGAGSLRDALICSNLTPGLDTISFNIPGAGPHTIRPQSPLPEITDPVVIDGYTQGTGTPDPSDDAYPNTSSTGFNGRILIELNGGDLEPGEDGLDIQAGGCTVRGLAVNGFLGYVDSGSDYVFGGGGIVLYEHGGNVIEGNLLGTDIQGKVSGANSFGVSVFYMKDEVPNRIGGTTPQARNVISGNDYSGVLIQENDDGGTAVEGNFIGTDVTGTEILGNGEAGVLIIHCGNNTIGGESPSNANLLSGNRYSGVVFFFKQKTAYEIQGNFIGTGFTATEAIGNELAGVIIYDGVGNSILSNSIAFNSDLGIALNDEGVTPNDVPPASAPPDLDGGPNNLQNYPVLTSAIINDGKLTIQGMLQSTPNTTFRIEYFANIASDPSGNGEGQRMVGSEIITTNAQGVATLQAHVPAQVSGGEFLSSTATRLVGGTQPSDTSEFSACIQINDGTGPTPTPTEPPYCPLPYPDFVQDDIVNSKDLMRFLKGLSESDPSVDLTGDQVPSAMDLLHFSLNWQHHPCPP